jgi:hypothetical protein
MEDLAKGIITTRGGYGGQTSKLFTKMELTYINDKGEHKTKRIDNFDDVREKLIAKVIDCYGVRMILRRDPASPPNFEYPEIRYNTTKARVKIITCIQIFDTYIDVVYGKLLKRDIPAHVDKSCTSETHDLSNFKNLYDTGTSKQMGYFWNPFNIMYTSDNAGKRVYMFIKLKAAVHGDKFVKPDDTLNREAIFMHPLKYEEVYGEYYKEVSAIYYWDTINENPGAQWADTKKWPETIVTLYEKFGQLRNIKNTSLSLEFITNYAFFATVLYLYVENMLSLTAEDVDRLHTDWIPDLFPEIFPKAPASGGRKRLPPYEKRTKKELQEVCKQRKIKITTAHTKADLIAKLRKK